MACLYPPDRSRTLAIVTTWPFVLALALLLLNDWLLKQAYPGFVTGKLSDFAGLAVVALPLFAAFPRHVRAIYLALAAAFLWWKSPVSNGFISFINDVQPLHMVRTVDYGDLVALAILPACAMFAASRPRGFVTLVNLRRWVLPPVLAAAVFGVMGTSSAMPRKDFAIRTIETSSPFPRDSIVKAIEEVAKRNGLKSEGASPPHWEGSFKGHDIFLTYSFPSPNEVAVGLNVNPGMFGNGETRRAERLRNEIKKTLTLRFKGLQYVELLDGSPLP
jgi:hypothetical protein